MTNDLHTNLHKLHTTVLGVERISRNLGLTNTDVIDWCKEKIESADDVVRNGKNWYVHPDEVTITVNAHSFTIITAHRTKSSN